MRNRYTARARHDGEMIGDGGTCVRDVWDCTIRTCHDGSGVLQAAAIRELQTIGQQEGPHRLRLVETSVACNCMFSAMEANQRLAEFEEPETGTNTVGGPSAL